MMNKANEKPIIIVKRLKRITGEEESSGTWKIAYADFVTAMMAFFLLMWLLGSSTQGDLKGISEYFRNPLKVTLMGGPSSGNSSSVIPGGGTDIEETYGQERKGQTTEDRIKQKAERLLSSAEKKAEFETMGAVQDRITEKIEQDPKLRNIKSQVKMVVTNEGLEIQIVDEENRPMFEKGRATPMPHMVEILETLSGVLVALPNSISITGHTDSSGFAPGAKYTNWELSADRSNAARRELERFGYPEDKILRVSGLADVIPINSDPSAAENRRIAIVVLNETSENEIRRKPRPENATNSLDTPTLIEDSRNKSETGSTSRKGDVIAPAEPARFPRPWE